MHYRSVKFKLPESLKVKRWLTEVSVSENAVINDLHIFFVDRKSIREINVEFLEHDYDTDVITFNYSESDSISGEIYIGIDKVKENSGLYNTTFRRETLRVVLHGLLHLIGYDDREERDVKEMREREGYFLNLWDKGGF